MGRASHLALIVALQVLWLAGPHRAGAQDATTPTEGKELVDPVPPPAPPPAGTTSVGGDPAAGAETPRRPGGKPLDPAAGTGPTGPAGGFRPPTGGLSPGGVPGTPGSVPGVPGTAGGPPPPGTDSPGGGPDATSTSQGPASGPGQQGASRVATDDERQGEIKDRPFLRELGSGAVTLESLRCQPLQRAMTSGSGLTDADITKIEQDLNDELEKIRETGRKGGQPDNLNYAIRETVDPTLQLKDPNASVDTPSGKTVNQEFHEGLDKQVRDAKLRIDRLFAQAALDVQSAFGKCQPTPPQTEPALCQSKQPLVQQSLEQWKQCVHQRIDMFSQRNHQAIDNPRSADTTTGSTTKVSDWKDAIQYMEGQQTQAEDEAKKAGESVAGEVDESKTRLLEQNK
jgi:hypothetical protein